MSHYRFASARRCRLDPYLPRWTWLRPPRCRADHRGANGAPSGGVTVNGQKVKATRQPQPRSSARVGKADTMRSGEHRGNGRQIRCDRARSSHMRVRTRTAEQAVQLELSAQRTECLPRPRRKRGTRGWPHMPERVNGPTGLTKSCRRYIRPATSCESGELIVPFAEYEAYIRGRMLRDRQYLKRIAFGIAVSLVIEVIAYLAIFGW